MCNVSGAVLVLLGLLSAITPAGVLGQGFPNRPVSLVVAYPPGSLPDIVAQIIAGKLGSRLGQEVVVKNRPGAGGIIGAEFVAKAASDGHTLILATGNLQSGTAWPFSNTKFDLLKRLSPISLVATVPNVLVVKSSLFKIRSIEDLIGYAKANPGKLKYGYVANDAAQLLAAESLKRMAGVDIVSVPYKATGPAISDVIGGGVEMEFATLLSVESSLHSGRLRALAVTGDKRLKALPDVPTVSEAAIAGFESSTWYGVLATAGTPSGVAKTLSNAIQFVLGDPEVQSRLTRLGVVPVGSAPEEFEAYIKAQAPKYARLKKDDCCGGTIGKSSGVDTGSVPPPPVPVAAAPRPPVPVAVAPPPPVSVAVAPPPSVPLAAAPPPPPIVYNADISPQLPANQVAPARPVLQAGQAATLRFDIGPKWEGSLLPNATPSPDILNSKENVPLTVVLSCGFCEPHAESLMRMTYMPSRGRSDEIRFQFTPQRRPDGSAYTDKLQLGIINDKTGREYDRLVIDVTVSGMTTAPVTTATNTSIAYVRSKGEARSDWSPDVLLYATEEMGRNVIIQIEPVSDEMKRRLGPLALNAQGERRMFRSGIDDAKLVEAMTNSAYGVMSQVSMQGDFLKRLSAEGTDAAVSKKSRQSLDLNVTESKNVSEAIANIGRRLYGRLFANSPDIDLRKLIVQLEAAADEPRDRPLRLKIITDKISLPWQYLHPMGPVVDAQKFWGLRFSLSVLRNNTGARGKGAAPDMEQAHKVVFARYGSSGDPTVPLADVQQQQLRMLPIADANLVPVDSGSDLLANLHQRRKEISAIFTFLHANFTTTDSEPQLLFNDGDIVTSRRLEDLLNELPMEVEERYTRYFTGAPLVILNACETGPSVNLPHVSLENVMFELGAQGVVVTEVSVWINLGHNVATRLISRLGKGDAIGDALTGVRRDLYAEKKNPLGLLYVYYGDPAATLRH